MTFSVSPLGQICIVVTSTFRCQECERNYLSVEYR
nr:MAG TPA: zinc-finger double domain protein [Caudoviricetes sp.]DAR88407.1 MAG TPA: hypothetical protein [Bacteriophage sp.]DAU34308.1 MAG TPA: hypothetical protein [Caudoviricetes sp.]